MPIVDIPQPSLSDVVDTPQGFAVTPGKEEIDHGSETPSFGSVIGASFRRDNTLGGFLSSEERDSPTFKQPGFNAWEKIKGTKYEPYAETFGEIRNDQAFANHVLQIDRENEDRKTIEAAPWYQKFPAAVAAGGLDLPTLLPGGAFVRGVKGGFSVARTAGNVALNAGASSALQEASLQTTQTTRTPVESATNIGASIFLGGLLGAGGAKLLSKAEWDGSVAAIERELGGNVSRETGFDAYHGSPHSFDSFSFDRIGTGEGATGLGYSSYGNGLYFSEHPAVAKEYAKNITAEHLYAAEIGGKTDFVPHEYQVRIRANKDNMLDWDVPISKQSQHVQDALKTLGVEGNETGAKVYQNLSQELGGDAAASKALADAGIPGNKYLDANSRGVGKGTQNFVVFNDKDIELTHKNGVPVPVPSSGSLSSVGAAATGPASLADNTIYGKAARGAASATSQLNPLLRALTSPSAAWRDISIKLFENSLYLKKNAEGIASEPAVETFMKEWNGGLASSIRTTDDAFKQYSKRGGTMARDEFNDAVGRAMRRGDESEIPEVSKVAKTWRSQIFDPLKEAAIEAKLLPEDVSVDTAASYFSRMWSRNKLTAQESRFKEIVTNYYEKAIRNEYQKSAENLTARKARLEQEIADLNLPADVRSKTLDELETAAREHESQWPSLSEGADRISEIRSEMRAARKAGDESAQARLKAEAETIKSNFVGDSLQAFTAKRSELATRRRHVDLGTAGLQERSDRVLGQLADLEETNQRAMERLVSKGQKLERDLDRLDADALEARVTQLADQYSALARKSESAAERAEQAIANMKAEGERGAERNRIAAEKSEAEAITGPAEEVAAKRTAAREASQKTAEKRAAADAKIQKRLEKEIETQRARAERMDEVGRRLEIAKNFDHDGLMEQIKDAITKATRETSAQSLARGERAAQLGERMAELDPKRVQDRVKTIKEMQAEAERKFIERWEVKHLGEGVGTERPDFTQAARDIADSAFSTLTGRVDAGVRPEFLKITTRGPMKDRTLNIPDELIEDFLEHDVREVGQRYTRVMGADVELAKKFGSVDMTDQLQAIRNDYARLRQGVTDEAQLLALAKREKSDIGDLEGVRDLLRGTRQVSPIEQNYARIVRSANSINYLRSMGEVVLASLTDAVRPAMVHGLSSYMQTVGQLVSNMQAVKFSVAEAQLAGNITERVLGQRFATLAEITDPYASRGPMERFLENMTNVASTWNGIRLWTDGMKSLSFVMTQNRVLGNVMDFAKIKPIEKTYLAHLGIDESMAGRIADQFAKHGDNIDGVHVANTEKWEDPVAVRYFRAAINKDVDSIIVQPSRADLPLFASTPTGKAILQFKSFALASNQRILLRGLQEDQSRFVGGVVAMTAMGMMMTYLKAISGNREEKLQDFAKNPGWWIAEGFDRAGVVAVPVELSNMFEKATGFNPIKTPMKAGDEGSAISQKLQNRSLLGTLVGPSAGLVDDLTSTAGIPNRMAKGEDISQGQKNAAERLLPFNSYLGVRQMLRYVINPQNP